MADSGKFLVEFPRLHVRRDIDMELNITFLFEIVVVSLVIPYLNYMIFTPLEKLSCERDKRIFGKKIEIDSMTVEINRQKSYISEQIAIKVNEFQKLQERRLALWENERRNKVEAETLACQNKYDNLVSKLQQELKEAGTSLSRQEHLLANMIYDKLHKR